MSKSLKTAEDLKALFRARAPLIWIVTREEARVEPYILQAAQSANFAPRLWDCVQGVTNAAGASIPGLGSPSIDETLAAIGERAKGGGERSVWVFRDLPVWLQPGPVGVLNLRMIRNLCRQLKNTARDNAFSLVVITPDGNVPADLIGHATVIEWPLPDREEIAAILEAAIEALPEEIRTTAAPNGQKDAAIDAAIGLSGSEAEACYAKSLVSLRRIDPSIVASEKKRVIARERILEWFDPLTGGLDAVGGLDVLKQWLISRKLAYSPKARAYGLPAPKGCLLVGVPGCGKSLTAKAIATAWQVPLIRLDLGALKSKFVGESEANLRKAFRVIESVGRCVVWLDEVEKALAGATQGAADGGVSADALGAVLSWMQEHTGESFVVATANDVSALPPELLRKGRFDELFFVDLPNATERTAILAANLKQHGRADTLAPIELSAVAERTEGFTGAELAALIPDALFSAFADGEREITIRDLQRASEDVVPLSKTASEKINRLREWAKGRARYATSAEVTSLPERKKAALDF